MVFEIINFIFEKKKKNIIEKQKTKDACIVEKNIIINTSY